MTMLKSCRYGHASGFYKCGSCITCTKVRARKSSETQKKKRRLNTKENLKSIIRICKRRICNNSFTPKKRRDQLFCSTLCCDRQGKEDWKNRNKKKYLKMERLRIKKKYETDEKFSSKRKYLANKAYHKLNDKEKFERNERNRLRADPVNRRNYARNYQNKKYKTDIHHRIASAYRARVRTAYKAKNVKKFLKTEEILGCSIDFFKKHLEKQFYPHPITNEPMTHKNHGKNGWHIDHIKPVKLFHLKTLENQKECFNYKNTAPLWEQENLRKSSKF